MMYEYNATIVRWIDGDTVDLTVDLGFSISSRHSVRLAGINAPELHTSAGPPAKARAIELAPAGVVVVIRTTKDQFDKYGRYLATIVLADGNTVNAILVAEGFAKPYNGRGPKIEVA